MNFTFPTADRWALFVINIWRPLQEDIVAAVFSFYLLSADYPAGVIQANWESGVTLGAVKQTFGETMPDGCTLTVNYYIQSGGKKFSGTSTPAFSASPLHSILPLGQSICIRRYAGARGDRFIGRHSLPFVPQAGVIDGSRFDPVFKLAINVHCNNYLSGYSFSGIHFRPVVYSPTHDTFTDVTAAKPMLSPRWVHRRRFRQRKVGHTFTPPGNWYTPGHF